MPRRGENIRKRKDGRWEGRFIKAYDSSGKAKYGSVYGRTYLDVKKKLNEAVEQVLNNTFPVTKHDLTFREVLFLWLRSNRIKLKDQTYAKYSHLIDKHILPNLGHVKIEKIDTETVNRFVYMKASTGRLDGNGGLAPSYMQTICFIISSALKFSIKEGYRSANIGSFCRPINKKGKQEINVLSHKEQAVLEKYLLTNIDERKLGVLLSLRMGLRVGEVCGLRWEDVDFAEKTVHIQHSVERIANIDSHTDKSKTRLVLCDTKTIFSNRIIPIPSDIMPLLVRCRKTSGSVLPGKTYILIQEHFKMSFINIWTSAIFAALIIIV